MRMRNEVNIKIRDLKENNWENLTTSMEPDIGRIFAIRRGPWA